MATAVSFGQITITDLTDIGTLSVYPTANQPLSVIYDPNQSTYTPNWGSSNLVLTPVIYYGGRRLYVGTTSGLTVTWTRQEGSSAATALTTGEAVSGGVLTVSANKFSTSSTMLSYIVAVNYTEPDSGAQLTAEGKITFSLVKQATAVKKCQIVGENVFKYNSANELISASSLVLTGNVENATISQWEYKNSSDVWTKYPGSTTSTTLTVRATDSTFVNDRCVIRLTTSDNSLFDLCTVVKIHDGSPGDKTVTAVLSNDDQMIPCDEHGNPSPDASTAFNGAVSTMTVYNGNDDDSSNWTFAVTDSGGITYTKSNSNRTVTVTAMSADTAHIYITASRTGYSNIQKTFSLVKIKAGADGTSPTVYRLQLSTVVLNKTSGENSTLSPSSITLEAFQSTGTAVATYDGRFRVYGLPDTGGAPLYSSTQDESTHTINTSTLSTSLEGLLVRLYEGGGFTNCLDAQTIVIAKDGDPGEQGEEGPGGVNVIVGNEAEQIACDSANYTLASTPITIPFYAVSGLEKVECTVTNPPKILGVTPTVTPANSSNSYNGSISWVIPANTAVNSGSGTLSLSFTVGSGSTAITVIHQFTWTRVSAAVNGENAVLLQLYSARGTALGSDLDHVDIQAALLEGSQDRTSNVTTWKWEAYGTTGYETITGATSSSYTVYRDDVSGFVSLRCTATYGGTNYVAYISVTDSTDPLHVVVMSSIGDQILNGSGAGAFYVLCYQGEDEVDALKSNRFLTAAPSTASSGDFYYHVDTTNKAVTLNRYNGSAWKTRATDTDANKPLYDYEGTYTWTHLQADGTTPASMATEGKVIYVDGSRFTKKMISNVRVQI